MNRNNERHFLNVPQMHTSRTRFNRDQTILTTFDSGKLIPFFVDEVLPGDTFQVDTSAIIRMTTPKYPVMDDAFIDFYYFYCPNRILWDDFKYFMGEVEDFPWAPTKEYRIPELVCIGSKSDPVPYEKSILDYMGVPTKIENTFRINALPVRAYVKIWNEYFRDENVDNKAALVTAGTDEAYQDSKTEENLDDILKKAYTGGRCLPINKMHDYFTSCLPYPQRGPEVNLPLTGNAAVNLFKNQQLTEKMSTGIDGDIYLNSTVTGANTSVPMMTNWPTGSNPAHPVLVNGAPSDTDASTYRAGFLGADLASVTATTINDLRKAVAVQQYYEALARGGSRYREQVQALWNVTISDKTVQIPEYLGGGRYHVNMNQIVQTSGQQSATDTPIGETGAMSVTPVNESSFTKSFEEHGFVIGVMCVRHNRSYQQGLERFWSRKDRLDYYVPQFANLGEQPVKKKEIMLTGTASDEETFGYQEAWADYRMKPNRVSGLMRSNATGTLDFWHYADNYDTVPTLSQGWMKEGKAEIARTLIVQNEPQFFGAIRVANETTRCMPLYSVPGLYKL
nr:MAG TPA: Major capsid protein [Microviridae sp.]